jgi:hypothetical protein
VVCDVPWERIEFKQLTLGLFEDDETTEPQPIRPTFYTSSKAERPAYVSQTGLTKSIQAFVEVNSVNIGCKIPNSSG